MQEFYREVIKRIVKEQQLLIGPIALTIASKIPGVKADSTNAIDFDATEFNEDAIEALINAYQALFGKAAVEVCKTSIKSMDNPNNYPLPNSLLS